MFRWTVETSSNLLSFIKKELNHSFNGKDLRFSIEHNRCRVNGAVERFASSKLKKNDQILFFPAKKPSFSFEKSRVLYEDERLLAYDKPAYISTENLGELLNLYPVHRLDRDTTGVLLFAKNSQWLQRYQDLFRSREIEKKYLAITTGAIQKSEGTILSRLQKTHARQGAAKVLIKAEGKESETFFRRLKKTDSASFIECKPLTGRTHQIRVHLQSIGHPILGDFEYGKKICREEIFRPLLHASSIEFSDPYQKEGQIKITAPLALDFQTWLETLF